MRLMFFIVAILFSCGLRAQTISRDAVTSGGGVFVQGGYELSVSYGQAVVASYDNNEQLNCGFQQGGSPCLGDFNSDGFVDTLDLLFMLSQFGCLTGCLADLNGDTVVNTLDLLVFLSFFGLPCP